ARAGWGLVFAPEARVVHFRGGSAPVKARLKAKKRQPAYLYASRTRLHRIVHGPLGPLKANLAWTFGKILSPIRLLFGKAPHRGVEAQWRDIWINFFDPLGDSRKPKE
ncbi:MAG: glycosyltransferase family 2 protein, partial [Pseudomonadota bacterium]